MMGQLVAMSDVRDSSLLWFAVTSASWGSRAPSRLPRLVRLLPGQKEVIQKMVPGFLVLAAYPTHPPPSAWRTAPPHQCPNLPATDRCVSLSLTINQVNDEEPGAATWRLLRAMLSVVRSASWGMAGTLLSLLLDTSSSFSLVRLAIEVLLCDFQVSVSTVVPIDAVGHIR